MHRGLLLPSSHVLLWLSSCQHMSGVELFHNKTKNLRPLSTLHIADPCKLQLAMC